jgi:hypothetical protein
MTVGLNPSNLKNFLRKIRYINIIFLNTFNRMVTYTQDSARAAVTFYGEIGLQQNLEHAVGYFQTEPYVSAV